MFKKLLHNIINITYNTLSIPKGDIGEAWILFLEKYNPLFKPTKTTKVCELHFDPGLYEITPTSVFKRKCCTKYL